MPGKKLPYGARPFADPEFSEEHASAGHWLRIGDCPACRVEYGRGGIDELRLSVRSCNCLRKAGILRVSTLAERSDAELLGLLNFGRKSLNEVRELLADRAKGERLRERLGLNYYLDYYYGA